MTEVAEKVTAMPLKEKRVQARKTDLKEEQHQRRQWWLKAAEGVTKDDIRHPEYLGPLAPRLSRHDLITIMAADESWEALLCVEAIRHEAVETSVRKVYARAPVTSARNPFAPGVYSMYEAATGWGVYREHDNHPVIFGHNIEAGARSQYLREYQRRA